MGINGCIKKGCQVASIRYQVFFFQNNTWVLMGVLKKGCHANL